MARATVQENGRVNVTLPDLSILVDRREAEGLRDALGVALPERIENLVLDPRIKDLHVLQAAQAIASEHQCHGVVKQLEHLVTLYYGDEAQLEDGRHMTEDARAAQPQDWKLYLLSIAEDVEPMLDGPFKDEKDRREAAQDYRRAHGDEDGLYRIDATGAVKVDTFSGNELGGDPGEDDPPTAAAPDERDLVQVGDRVRDPFDGMWRTVERIDGTTVFMADGGCMGLQECAASDIRLPSEALGE